MMLLGIGGTLATRGLVAAFVALAIVAAIIVAGSFLNAAGWLGGGDVKFFAGVAAFLTPADVVVFFLCTNIAGGVLLLISSLHERRIRKTVTNLAFSVIGGSMSPGDSEPKSYLPYGVAICAATLAIFALHAFAPGVRLPI